MMAAANAVLGTISADLTPPLLTPAVAAGQASFPLSETWCMWFHMFEDNNWDIKSYRLVYSFDNVSDFWRMYNNMPSVFSGMYFVMKKGIMPTYEDPKNLEGSLYSFRILNKKKLQEVWNDLLLSLIGNTLYPWPELINGVSINPKNCVIKVWLSAVPPQSAVCRITNQISYLYPEKALFLRTKNGT